MKNYLIVVDKVESIRDLYDILDFHINDDRKIELCSYTSSCYADSISRYCVAHKLNFLPLESQSLIKKFDKVIFIGNKSLVKSYKKLGQVIYVER